MNVIEQFKTDTIVNVPKGALILSVGLSKINNYYESSFEVVVYALIDTDEKETERRLFKTAVNGELTFNLDDLIKFIGTISINDYPHHIFEVKV